MTKVLLTGIGGFVGVHLAAHIFANTDWDIVAIDSFRHKGKPDRVRDLLEAHPEYKPRLDVIMYDLKAPISDQMDKRIGEIDYVLSVASESHVDRSIADPRTFIENNTSLILTLMEWLRNHPEVKTFLHTSTDEVYGPAYTIDHKEGEPHRPSNPYSASKAAQEDILYAYWRTYGLPIQITNTMNMFGGLQETEKFVPMIIKNILAGEPVTAHVSPEGIPGSRYYLHVRNQCDAQLFLLRNTKPSLYPADDLDRFNIVSDDEIDNIEMINRIAAILGKPVEIKKVNFHESRPGHDLRYGLDGQRMKDLGWTQPVPFDQSLAETVAWYLERPEWIL